VAFTGIGQNDSGGQATPGVQPTTIVWANAATPTTIVPIPQQRSNTGVLYQAGGGGTTTGFGQIFPTGRS
jgi:hypothetical protein